MKGIKFLCGIAFCVQLVIFISACSAKPEVSSTGKTSEVSVGSVAVISGEVEYTPYAQVLYGLSDGIFFDALIEQPREFADKLALIPYYDDFRVSIDGGILWGNRTFRLYRLTEDEWLIEYVREHGYVENGDESLYEDPPGYEYSALEQGDYILSITLAWQNGLEGNLLEYVGYQYSFRLVAAYAP